MDFKSQLQELIQRDDAGPLEYKIFKKKDLPIIENLFLLYS